MQLVWSRIWTRVTVSISYDDNHYTTGTWFFTHISLSFFLSLSSFLSLSLSLSLLFSFFLSLFLSLSLSLSLLFSLFLSLSFSLLSLFSLSFSLSVCVSVRAYIRVTVFDWVKRNTESTLNVTASQNKLATSNHRKKQTRKAKNELWHDRSQPSFHR